MDPKDLLRDYDQLHEPFFSQYAAMLCRIYRPAIDAKVLAAAVVDWRRVRATNQYMNLDINRSLDERLASFLGHARYLQEDDALEREFDECIPGEHDYLNDDIDVIESYGEEKERLWSHFIAAVEKMVERHR